MGTWNIFLVMVMVDGRLLESVKSLSLKGLVEKVYRAFIVSVGKSGRYGRYGYDWADSETEDSLADGELRNGAKRAAVPRGRRRSAAPVVGHHGHSTAPPR